MAKRTVPSPNPRTMRFKAPVSCVVMRDGDQDLVGGFCDAEIAVVDSADAPVVAIWTRPQQEVVFRAHAGRLMVGKFGSDAWVHPIATTKELVRGQWEGDKFFWDAIDDELFRDYPFRASYGAAARDLHFRIDRSVNLLGLEDDSRELDAAMEDVRQQIGEAIVVDGQVFVPTTGPLIKLHSTIRSRRGTIDFEIGQPRRNDYAHACYSAFDHEQVREVVERRFPGTPLYGQLPEVLSTDGWSIEATRAQLAQQSLAYMVDAQVNEVEREPLRLQEASRDFVRAFQALRTLKERPAAAPEIWREAVADFAVAAPTAFKAGYRGRLVDYWLAATEIYAEIGWASPEDEALSTLSI